MPELKLPKLPDRIPIRMSIMVPPDLNQSLVAYAELYREIYGKAEPIHELIPAMLASFLDGDRAFAMHRRKGKAR